MKRNNLTTAVIAGIAGVAGIASLANAVELNPDGLGQVLIYPYYTVNANNVTLVSVVNTTGSAKAVKVRFLEGYNSQEVLDFNLFLSRFDVWTANVFSLSATGGGNLLTDDESCTIPDIKGATGPGLGTLPAPDGRSYVLFRNGQYQTDGGPKTIDRTREGHIELIEMASIALGSNVEEAVTHDQTVSPPTPPGCSGLTATVAANLADLLNPTGGLFGSGNIVNPIDGTLLGYNAEAIDGFYALGNTLYTGSGSTLPSLASTRTNPAGADAYNFGKDPVTNATTVITSNYSATNAIDAVSSVFTASVISNEYVIEAVSASESEWVITFPTKKFYVNTTPAIAPFIQRFAAPGRSCVLVGISYYNREESTVTTVDDFSPPTDNPPSSLCYEAQVLTFQRAADYTAAAGVSKVLGSKLTANIDPRASGFTSGWLRIDLNPTGSPAEPHALRPSVDGDVFHGLPAIGFLATNYLNRNNGGPNVLSTYSALYRHRAERSCTNTVTGVCS